VQPRIIAPATARVSPTDYRQQEYKMSRICCLVLFGALAGAMALANPLAAAELNLKQAVEAAKTASAVTAADSGGEAIFAKGPIDPSHPPKSTGTFVSGDHIYGLLVAPKPWGQLTRDPHLLITLSIDGRKHPGLVGLRRDQLLAQDTFVLDIAPDPDKMTNYRDQDIVWQEQFDGASKQHMRWGPAYFTALLGELPAGSHTVHIEVKLNAKIIAAGDFVITGKDFGFYRKLHQRVADTALRLTRMPPRGLRDDKLEAQMLGLLKSRGYAVERLYVADKAWTVQRLGGVDGKVRSRSITAAVASKDGDAYYYANVSFLQMHQSDGSWGPLQVMRLGERQPILKENIAK
jgi:hypothetical protein